MKFPLISLLVTATFAASSLAATSDTADSGEILQRGTRARDRRFMAGSGPDKYTVGDFKATATLRKNVTASLGCGNVGDDRYHVYHPMPERTFFTEVNWSR